MWPEAQTVSETGNELCSLIKAECMHGKKSTQCASVVWAWAD